MKTENLQTGIAVAEAITQPDPMLGQRAGQLALHGSMEGSRSFDHAEGLTNHWWKGTKAEKLIEGSLREAFQAGYEGAEDSPALDILNCSSDQLSPEDLQATQDTIQKVAAFTQGKVFDRVKGVIFANDDQFSDGGLGGYRIHGGYLQLNIDKVRKQEGELLPRYQRYFKDQPDISTFEVNLAHEIGHSFDVHSKVEAQAHGVELDKVWDPGLGLHKVSAFHSQVGWRHSVQDHAAGLLGKVDQWNMDDATMSENNEYPPTAYAAIQPAEDFAESFAIVALAGDTSTLPVREGVIRSAVAVAEGRTYQNGTISMKDVTL